MRLGLGLGFGLDSWKSLYFTGLLFFFLLFKGGGELWFVVKDELAVLMILMAGRICIRNDWMVKVIQVIQSVGKSSRSSSHAHLSSPFVLPPPLLSLPLVQNFPFQLVQVKESINLSPLHLRRPLSLSSHITTNEYSKALQSYTQGQCRCTKTKEH